MARNSNSKNKAKKPERQFKQQGNVTPTSEEAKSKTDECSKEGKKCTRWGKKNGGTCSRFGRLCSETRV